MLREALRTALPASVLDLLRRARAWLMAWRYPRRVVRHDYGSVFLRIELADPMAEAWYDRDWPVMAEIDRLSSGRLGPGALVFDLGAHQGVVALVLADRVGADGCVVAVEPVEHNVALARRNFRRNGYENVVVRRGVVSDDTSARAYSGTWQARLGSGSQKIQSFTVDALSEQYGEPDVVYIDVEGAESQVLRGAARTLEASCDWFVEVHTGAGLEELGGSVDEVLSYFPERGYEVQVAPPERDGEFLPVTEVDEGLLKRRFALVARRTR